MEWDPGNSEAVFRVAAFAIIFALLAALETLWPHRPRTLARRHRWADNLGLVVVGAVLVRVTTFLSAVAAAGLAEARGWGLLQAIGPMPIWVRIVASIVLLDLAIYLQHVVFHALPSLWRLHRVHHTDLELDVTSGVRFHPIEILLSAGLKAAAVGVLGAPVAGVIAFEIVLNAGSLWSHANLRIPEAVDRFLRLVIVTPNMHRVHHSIDGEETDCNFGFTLSWWDALFGTYRQRSKMGDDAMAFGVAGFDTRDTLGLGRLLLQPILREPSLPGGARRSIGDNRTSRLAPESTRTNIHPADRRV